jgi:hypothetical protein
MSQQNSILLFYSAHCNHCSQLLQTIKQSQLQNSIQQICIDKLPRHRIPGNVKNVPTLVIAGTMQPLVGQNVFKWVQQKALEKKKQIQASSVSNNTSESGPSAWHGSEMGPSFSDPYSFINASKESSIPKNFEFITENNFNVKDPFPNALSQQPQQSQSQQRQQQQAQFSQPQQQAQFSQPQQQPQFSQPQQQPQFSQQQQPQFSQQQPQFSQQQQPQFSQQQQYSQQQQQYPQQQQPQFSQQNINENFDISQMSPPNQNTDDLSQRMENLQMARETDVPQQAPRIGSM